MKAILLTALLVALHSQADATVYFDSVGASCVPGDPAVTGDLYNISAGAVTHHSTATSLVSLYCPIPSNITAPSNVELLFSSTENNVDTYVTASYIKMHKTSGGITTIATARSQDATNNGTVQLRTQSFTDTYDASNYTYYVRVDLKRRNTSQSVAFYKVTLY